MPQQLAVLAYETTQAVCTPHPLPRAQPPARLLALKRVHLTLCTAPGRQGQLRASVQGMWAQAGLPPVLILNIF